MYGTEGINPLDNYTHNQNLISDLHARGVWQARVGVNHLYQLVHPGGECLVVLISRFAPRQVEASINSMGIGLKDIGLTIPSGWWTYTLGVAHRMTPAVIWVLMSATRSGLMAKAEAPPPLKAVLP